MAVKSKSLLSQTSAKKKEDKYKEISDIKSKSKFEVSDQILIYTGTVFEYRGLECTIVKKSTRKNVDYYRVKFDDDKEIGDVTDLYLKTIEVYQQLLLDQDNEKIQGGISDEEVKIRANGLEPMKNFVSCHNQLKLVVEKSCETCGHVDRCIYRGKYKYDKVKF